jgi:hypothetical protein
MTSIYYFVFNAVASRRISSVAFGFRVIMDHHQHGSLRSCSQRLGLQLLLWLTRLLKLLLLIMLWWIILLKLLLML